MVLPGPSLERRGRRARGLSVAALITATLVVGYWLTIPPERVVLDEECAPNDIPAQLSAWFYGAQFWQSQEIALTDEIKTLQDLRNTAKENTGRPVDMTPIEVHMRRLSDKERAALVAGDEETWSSEILFLGRCETVARARLGQ